MNIYQRDWKGGGSEFNEYFSDIIYEVLIRFQIVTPKISSEGLQMRGGGEMTQ